MRFASGLLVAALFGSGVSAQEVPACVFDKVVAFGASVTQATPAMIPGYRSFVVGAELYGSITGNDQLPNAGSPLRNFTYRPWGLSPVRYLVKNYMGAASAKKIEYIGKYFTQSEEDLGSFQIRELLIGGKKTTFENTTLLVGVDAFYWDAIWNNCGYGKRVGVEDHIRLLTRTASHRGLTLVLGNVPHENPTTVRIDSERIGIPGLWYAPDVTCARQINRVLEESCLPENGCYIADLRGAVEDLQCGKKLKLRNGEEFSLYEMRPDGVHMSDKGARYIGELMIRGFEAAPPKCAP